MTDDATREFAKLLAGQDAAARQSLLQQANALAMNQADPESFEAPIRSLGDYLADPIEVPPVLVTPNLLVRGSVNCTLGRAGKGKRQRDDALVYTTGGPRRIDALTVGDALIDPDGGRSTVTGVYPHGTQEMYRVTFSDGAVTHCGPEHLWTVSKWNSTLPRTIELREIIGNTHNARGDALWYVPMPTPCEFNTQQQPIPAYTLGVLLGDGCISNNHTNFVVNDDEIVERVRAELPDGTSLRKCGQHPLRWRILGPAQGSINPVSSTLRDLGLFGLKSYAKFIPDQYQHGNVRQRVQLLRGLLDTDGGTKANGHSTRFYSCSSRLAYDVAALVRSLGGSARVNYRRRISIAKRGWSDSYTVTIRMPASINPFALDRKATRWRQRNPLPPYRSIASVERVEDAPSRCIATDAARGLYITDDFVVTHNTSMNLNRLIRWSTGSPVFSTLKNKDGDHLMAPAHPLKTLIVENEGAAGMFHRHIGLMLNAPGVLTEEERRAAEENVLIWGDGGYSNLKLDQQQHLDWVRAGLERWSPDVVYVEPFRSLWAGEENSATDMAVVVDSLSNLAKDYDCAVLIAHHERKAGVGEDGEKMSAGRGSTVLEGVVATMENHQSAVGGDYRELTWSKIRYAETEWPAPVRLQWDMESRWYRHVPLAETEQKVMEVLVDEDDALSVRDIADQTGETERKVRDTLKALEEGKRVKAMKSISDGFGSSGKRYRIPTSDNDEGQKGLDV